MGKNLDSNEIGCIDDCTCPNCSPILYTQKEIDTWNSPKFEGEEIYTQILLRPFMREFKSLYGK